MGDCFRLGENLGLCMLISCLMPTNCFHSFFVLMRFSVCFVNITAFKHCFMRSEKMLIVISGCVFIFLLFHEKLGKVCSLLLSLAEKLIC